MEETKGPARNWTVFAPGRQDGTPLSGEDTHVAVVESAPQMNAELMVVFARDEMPALVRVGVNCLHRQWLLRIQHYCGCGG